MSARVFVFVQVCTYFCAVASVGVAVNLDLLFLSVFYLYYFRALAIRVWDFAAAARGREFNFQICN